MKKSLAMLLFPFFTTQAFAETQESKTASILIQQDFFNYSTIEHKEKSDGGSEVKSKTNSVSTMDNSLMIIAYLENWAIYVFPTNPNSDFYLGHLFNNSTIEVGVHVGLDSKKIDKPKNENERNSFGLYGVYYAKEFLSPKATLELGLDYGQISEKSTEVEVDKNDKETTVKSNTTTSNLILSAYYVRNIYKNVSYVGGLSYTSSNAEEKERKIKTAETNLTLKLAAIRLEF